MNGWQPSRQPLDLSGPSTVYRCYDSAGQLIYVGCTKDWPTRQTGHGSQSWWWPQTVRVVCEELFDRESGKAREREIITTEHPLYNIAGRPRDRLTWTRENYAAEIRALSFVDPGYVSPRMQRLKRELAARFPEAVAA